MGGNSQTTVSRTKYGRTSTTNPYAQASTNNSGTISGFKDGTAFDTIYNFVNKNINSMLDDYLNPNLNSLTNQSKINSYKRALNSSTAQNLENNIINPLSNRNMVRSSQATDMYKNLSNQNVSSLDDYISGLLSESQDKSAQMLNDMLANYLKGYSVISDVQRQSLQTSSGNATNVNKTKSSGSGTDALSTLLPLIISMM